MLFKEASEVNWTNCYSANGQRGILLFCFNLLIPPAIMHIELFLCNFSMMIESQLCVSDLLGFLQVIQFLDVISNQCQPELINVNFLLTVSSCQPLRFLPVFICLAPYLFLTCWYMEGNKRRHINKKIENKHRTDCLLISSF